MLSLFKKLLDRNKPIKTLGGASRDTEIPVDNGTVSGDMSFRPMMPYPSGDAPVNPSEYQGNVSGDIVARPLMPIERTAIPMDNTQSLNMAVSPKSPTKIQIDRRDAKDFSKTKNEDGTYTYGKDYDKDHNWWDVVKGIGIGFTKGGLGGAIGGGIGAAFDPNYDEKWGNQMQLQGLQKQYAGEMGVRKMEDEEELRRIEREKTALQGTKEYWQSVQARLKAIQDQNPGFLEGLKQKGFVTEADAARAKELGLGEVPVMDAREFETMWGADGSLLAYPKKGGLPNPQPTGIVDPKEGTVNYGGFAVKPKEGLDAKVRQEEAQAGRDQSAAQFNASQELEVQKANIANQMKDSGNIIAANAQIIANAPVAQNAAQAMALASEQFNNATDSEAQQKAVDAFNKAQKEFGEAIGKVQGGEAIRNQLKQAPVIEFNPISSARAGVPSRASLESTLRARGHKPNSAEWNKVMQAAGYGRSQ